MTIYLIRHGATRGNEEKRYIGRTDEPLSEKGREALIKMKKACPHCERVVASPMKRCTETAELIFGEGYITCGDLRECDFGRFEGHNYAELNGDPDYQAWIDSGGKLPFPGGESPGDFKERSCKGFLEALDSLGECSSAAFVVHGGTIMSVLERFALPHQDYYSYMTENGGGYACQWDGKSITQAVKL